MKMFFRILLDNICYSVGGQKHNVFDEPLCKETKVMSYNIRCDSDKDGEHNWEYRKRCVADVIRQERAGIVCLQELAPHTLKYLLHELGDYDCYSVDARNGKPLHKRWFDGYGLAILYDRTRYIVEKEKCIWLSDRVNKPSRTWGNEEYRVAIRLTLVEKKSGKVIHVFNTHFDHTSMEIIKKSAELLRKRVNVCAGEVFLAGDFNAEISTLDDLNEVLFNNLEDDTPTFTGYHFVGKKVLDTIYTRIPYKRKVIVRRFGEHNASDHCAVVIENG